MANQDDSRLECSLICLAACISIAMLELQGLLVQLQYVSDATLRLVPQHVLYYIRAVWLPRLVAWMIPHCSCGVAWTNGGSGMH